MLQAQRLVRVYNMAANDEDETFVTVGSALPPYEEDDEVKQKPVPIHEQKVVDERGRQRFHGAFTGGFSAGYWNTVGSKEGFTPTTFVSKRSDRELQKKNVPEDFMDEEDVGEFGIAPRQVAATKQYAAQRRPSKAQSSAASGIIPGMELLQELVVPANLPIGVELLRGLGWKEGQGIGPRVNRRKRKKKKKDKQGSGGGRIYGCAPPPATGTPATVDQDSESSEDDFIPSNVTFAPKDTTPVNFDPKTDTHGLGYSGIQHQSHGGGGFSLFDEPPGARAVNPGVSRGSGRKGITGAAFGIGAFEDEDDVDVYSTDSMSRYNRVLDEPDQDANHGWTAPKHRDQHKKALNYVRKVLDGFKIASKSSVQPPSVYAPPQIPRGYRPRRGGGGMGRGEVGRGGAAGGGGQSRESTDMNAGNRADMLGEQPEIKSVFDLISKEDRDKLTLIRSTQPILALKDQHRAKKREEEAKKQAEEAKMREEEEKKREEEAKKQEEEKRKKPLSAFAKVLSSISQPATTSAPTTATSEATQKPQAGSTLYKVGMGFQPFASNPEKQVRYDAFLEAKKKGEKYGHGDLTEWEAAQEREEFSRAAQMYRPLTSLMASRFTRAQFNDEDKSSAETAAELQKVASVAETAAEGKQFGKLTREILEWHPEKVLCKRFNIPNPYPDSDLVGVPRVKRDKFSVFSFLGLPPSAEEEEKRKKREEEELEKKLEEIKKDSRRSKKGTSNFKPLAILGTMDLRPVPKTTTTTDATKTTTSTDMATTSKDSTLKSSDSTMDTAEKTVSESGTEREGEGEEEEETDENKEEDSGRPPMDLFKAIFADSESSSDSEVEKEEEKKEVAMDTGETKKDNGTIPVESLPSRLSPKYSAKNSATTTQRMDSDSEPELYGPSLPSAPGSSSREEPEVVDLTKSKKSRHKEKKKHKKKSSKHKKSSKKKHKKDKKKKKKKEKKVSDSSSSRSSDEWVADTDGDDDDDGPSNQELLSRLKSLPKSARAKASDFW